MKGQILKLYRSLLILCFCCLGLSGIFTHRVYAVNPTFTKLIIQPSQAPWGKSLADLNGDNQLDIIEGGGGLGGAIYWYQYPTWTKFQIGSVGGDDDLQVGDINKDGALDVVVNGGTYWYENPRGGGGNIQSLWTRHTIDAGNDGHDVVVGDVNADTKLDVLTRGEFGPTALYLQGATPDTWTAIPMPNAPDGEASALADINRDGRVDIVGNGYWLQQPTGGITNGASWLRRDFGSWPVSGSAAVADINHDGRLDVFLAASEIGVGTLSWFEAPVDPITGTWIQHDIDTVSDVHRFHLVDIDKDGDLDIAFSEMHQSSSKRVGVYYNSGLGASWTLQILATTASHNIAVGDVGNDGDIDIVGANWSTASPDGGSLNLWRNDINPGSQTLLLNRWTYIHADSNRASQKFGIDGAFDLTGDGYKDIVSGEYFYRNPGGNMTGTWTRTTFPNSSFDALLSVTVDNDAFGDVIAMNGNGQVFWLEATNTQGTGWSQTLIGAVGSADEGISSQGYLTAQLNAGGKPEIIINVPNRLSYFEIPDNPAAGNWPNTVITTVIASEPEGVTTGDIDKDGDLDIVSVMSSTQVAWWANPAIGGSSWVQHNLGTLPGIFGDRFALADLDGDGDLDLAATVANGTTNGVYWFQSPTNPAGAWTRNTILSNSTNPAVDTMNSMDSADMDKDGDIDIITAEHRGSQRVFILENGGTGTFTARTISNGIENHLGARVFDLDGDSDLDIIGIAWDGYPDLHVWRNDAISGGGTITPSPTGPSPSSTPSPTSPPSSCPKKSQGDANCDGRTTLSDYEHWRREFRKEVTSTLADFTPPPGVSLSDYEAWRANFF